MTMSLLRLLGRGDDEELKADLKEVCLNELGYFS